MRKMIYFVAVLIITLDAAYAAADIDDPDLRRAVDELSASTLVGGEGWQTYGSGTAASGFYCRQRFLQ